MEQCEVNLSLQQDPKQHISLCDDTIVCLSETPLYLILPLCATEQSKRTESADGQGFSSNSSQILFIHQALLRAAEKSGKTVPIVMGVSFCGVHRYLYSPLQPPSFTKSPNRGE